MKDIRFKMEDKLCEELKEFCKVNHMTISSYVLNAVTERFNIDRYGDMNVMKANQHDKIPEYSVDKKLNYEHKEIKEEEIKPVEEVAEIKEEKVEEPVNEVNENKPRRRQLNAK